MPHIQRIKPLQPCFVASVQFSPPSVNMLYSQEVIYSLVVGLSTLPCSLIGDILGQASIEDQAESRKTRNPMGNIMGNAVENVGGNTTYKQAGVDIDEGQRTVELMKQAVRSTFTANVLADVGAFGGLFALSNLPQQPVLVASTDGVGTKVKLAAQVGRWEGIGHDIVNHCVNDILVQNARPLFFLDYVATSKLVPEAVAEVVTGVAHACRAVGCALLGGETAEMPGVYTEGSFDLAGTVVGLVDRAQILPRPNQMQAGDLLVGLPSSGPHTNGYSLIRKLIAERDLHARLEDGQTLLDALLAPHRCYVSEINLLQAAGIELLGMAHITGGGFIDNLPRVLPLHLQGTVYLQRWRVPALFRQLATWGDLPIDELFRVFNMGIGMILIVPATAADSIRALLPEAVFLGQLETRAEAQPSVRLIDAA